MHTGQLEGTPCPVVAGIVAVVGAALILLIPVDRADAAAPSCIVSEARVVWDAGADAVRADGAISAEGGVLTLDDGTGVIEPVSPSGSVSFDGTLVYTSAAGVETTLSAPTLVIDGASGSLLFDVQPKGAEPLPQAALATVDLGSAVVSETTDAMTLDGVDAPTDATAEGRDVLWTGAGGGLELMVAADCTTEADTVVVVDEETDAPAPGILVPIIVVGIAAVVAAVLAVGSVQRRKRNSATAAPADPPRDPVP